MSLPSTEATLPKYGNLFFESRSVKGLKALNNLREENEKINKVTQEMQKINQKLCEDNKILKNKLEQKNILFGFIFLS